MLNISLDRRGDAAHGEIIIGAFHATFAIDTHFWSAEEYRASWSRTAAAVLEHGYGRFLTIVGAPGATFTTWPCFVRGDEAVLYQSFLLSSITGDFTDPSDAERFDPEWPIESEQQNTLNFRRCSLSDIADFERRLRGAKPQ